MKIKQMAGDNSRKICKFAGNFSTKGKKDEKESV